MKHGVLLLSLLKRQVFRLFHIMEWYLRCSALILRVRPDTWGRKKKLIPCIADLHVKWFCPDFQLINHLFTDASNFGNGRVKFKVSWQCNQKMIFKWKLSQPFHSQAEFIVSKFALNKLVWSCTVYHLESHEHWTLSGRTSYRKISERPETAMIVSFQSLAGSPAGLLPRCLPNFRAIENV